VFWSCFFEEIFVHAADEEQGSGRQAADGPSTGESTPQLTNRFSETPSDFSGGGQSRFVERPQPATGLAGSSKITRYRPWQLVRAVLPRLATVAISLLALLVAVVTWDIYVTSPWTRDGRVRVQVASVAPEVSGKITQLRIADNQFVHKGDPLYEIDPVDFDVTLRTNEALLSQRQADLHVKELQFARREKLSDLATTPEEQQVFEGSAMQARAAVEAAQQQVAQARINLSRTEVLSPVSGYITNLLLRGGDYAHTGVSNISVIDAESFWIDGYFEETKLARICVGDRAEAKLMGYARPIVGHVTTVTRGVSVSDAAPGTQGLPSVDPVYTWVRLAQRVPIRISIDQLPAGVPLVSGTTATVTIDSMSDLTQNSWFERFRSMVRSSISDVVNGVSPRMDCTPIRF
jgi:RND family efflux transporter MFP subunit